MMMRAGIRCSRHIYKDKTYHQQSVSKGDLGLRFEPELLERLFSSLEQLNRWPCLPINSPIYPALFGRF